MNIKWDRHWLAVALLTAGLSKDRSTQVGSVLVTPDNLIVATGYNGFPRGIADDHRLEDRDTKLRLIVHAEVNAILGAARLGRSTQGLKLYTACRDSSGAIWGGPPCTRCAVECIQAGIHEVISYPQKTVPSRWTEDLKLAEVLLAEAYVTFRSLPIRKDHPIASPRH